MLFTVMQIFYVIVAVLMIAFILLQRGAGAQAGSGFGAGASGTVFGARGSANFLSRSTAVLCVLFFALSMGMAGYIAHADRKPKADDDLGIMGAATMTSEATSDLPVLAPETTAPAAAPAAPAPATEAEAQPEQAEEQPAGS